ncbi:exonuclease 3'-5' domain-containing protein 2-like [Toxorhynchites rutilus septentrionalis]|uniref:exonuclease 3'-5' domain-containing protein 2-like n=1 Tax=Toxorhynchites rutilus septentrionalis TaxID=329112 RepID=UPI0024791E83|nr:exonuclease 3'-5' domain-containing protein 2-like [Toxorhynchites rutilus septentrionalis]
MRPFVVLAGAGIGACALAWLLRVIESTKSCHITNAISNEFEPIRYKFNSTIYIINTTEKCRKVIRMFQSQCERFPVLGFDCQWEQYGSYRKKVALLQLVCDGGLCALIKLRDMDEIPSELFRLLGDPSILKVGMEPQNKAYNLWADYRISVKGTLDLSTMYVSCGMYYTRSLAELALKVLNRNMMRMRPLRDSDWNQPILNAYQIKYAEEVAYVSFELFLKLGEKAALCSMWTGRKIWLSELRSKFSNEIIYSNKYNRSGECLMVVDDLLNPMFV